MSFTPGRSAFFAAIKRFRAPTALPHLGGVSQARSLLHLQSRLVSSSAYKVATTSVDVAPDIVHPPFARYSHASVVQSDAKLIFTSGQLGIRPDGTIPVDVEAQAELAFGNIASILQAAGAGVEHIVRLNSYVTGREHLQGYMRARDAFIGDLPPAASTLMIVSGFARPEFVVEIEAIAALPPDAAPKPPPSSSAASGGSVANAARGRRAMHAAARGPHRRALHTEKTPPESVDAFLTEMREKGVRVLSSSGSDDERREVKRLSRDFFWYSPVLKPRLTGLSADCLVLAKTEADVVACLAAGIRHGVPVTTRGGGTGNYGQAVPLRGGVVLDVTGLDTIEAIDVERGTVRAGAGAKIGDIEDAARAVGWELRQHPSTRRTATIGGFVAGGSTGHGAMLHGGLSEDGAILGLRVATAEVSGAADDPASASGEPTPRILELSGRDVFPVVHAYGTNGVITAVEMPLARAQPWTDVTAGFPSLASAAAFALDVANAPAIVSRAISTFQAPIPHKFLDADTLMHGPSVAWGDSLADGAARHVTMVQCAPASLGPVERLASEHGGQLSRTIAAADAPRPFYEFGWNHTTLHALKSDKAVTYLQAVLEPARALELVDLVAGHFSADELMQHLEVVNFNGRYGFASLALLKPSGGDAAAVEARIGDILKWHEENGLPVFDPHTHILEDGGMKVTDWAQLGFKRRVDPRGLLNPGKMRAWEEQKASVETSDPRGAFAASYRLADTSAVGTPANSSGSTVSATSTASTASTASSTTNASTASTATTPRRPRSRLWAEWSTEDFATADLSEAVAILPLGAVEAHGPHLPLGVDAMHNAALLRRALARLPAEATVLALPPMDVGVSCEHSGFVRSPRFEVGPSHIL